MSSIGRPGDCEEIAVVNPFGRWTGNFGESDGIEHPHLRYRRIVESYRDALAVRGESSGIRLFPTLDLRPHKQLQSLVFDGV